MARPLKHGVPTRVLSLRMPAEYVEAVKAAAEARGMGPAELVMRLVERAGLVERPAAEPTPTGPAAPRDVTPRPKRAAK